MQSISLKIVVVSVFSLLFNNLSQAQQYPVHINWTDLAVSKSTSAKLDKNERVALKELKFEGASTNLLESSLPRYNSFFTVNTFTNEVEIEITEQKYTPVSTERVFSEKELSQITDQIVPSHYLTTARKQRFAVVSFYPFRKNTSGKVEALVDAKITIKQRGNPGQVRSSGFSFVDHSVLETGEWYKISTGKDGVYRIDYNFLSALGIDINNIDPNQINIYGHGGEMLPMDNAIDRSDDLPINSIHIQGGDDGSFDTGDYILFYAKGPDSWSYQQSTDRFEHEKHRYSSKAYYFIGIGTDTPKRVEDLSTIDSPPTHMVNTFDERSFHEVDLVNLTQSGRQLYGESFDLQTEYVFSGSGFTYNNIDQTSPVSVRARIINLTFDSNDGEWTVACNGNSEGATISGVNTAGSYNLKGRAQTVVIDDFLPTNDNLSVTINFQKEIATEEGWLDFIEINGRRNLIMAGSQMEFRDVNSLGSGNIAEYSISSGNTLSKIWDVTDPTNVRAIADIGEGDLRSFRAHSDSLREFIAFKNSGFLSPEGLGSVNNQDLHGLTGVDMIILSPPLFINQANDLADFHEEEGLSVHVVTPQQVYNEFSSGNPDITAIKSFCKMFYDRAGTDPSLALDYLLLMGDASYINNNIDPASSPLILSYQSSESLAPLFSYIADDYFGFLDDEEGDGLNNSVDIGIGRFPATNVDQVNDIINKIKVYASRESGSGSVDCFSDETSVYGDWRSRALFVADDENGTTHIDDSDRLARHVEDNYQGYNVNKIYMDAYPQITTAGGERYPGVEKDLRENIERGALLVTYFGHGGEVGWAHERVFDLPTIQEFTNLKRLPVFLTATCEFSRFDDPNRISAGEQLLLNPNGGAIALLSTSRPVFANDNFDLGEAFYYLVFEKDANEIEFGSSGSFPLNHGLRLGDINRITKNGIGASVNKRNFTLLGDPALKMAYPKHRIVQDQILDQDGLMIDTIQALQLVTIKGHVEDIEGNLLSGFNGYVTPIVFDKAKLVETLVNDELSSIPYEFFLQTNVLYKGNTSVENGEFEYSFIVPKDISYQAGTGRIGYYGVGNDVDAFGFNHNDNTDQTFYISGQNSDADSDNVGPEITLYLDSEDFVDGGITNEDPVFIAQIRDDHGVNTSNSGIGHDITLTIDNDDQNIILLNDLYRSDLDTYQSGSIRYPIKDLADGPHTIKLKAWDIYNNSSEKTIDFEVASANDLVLDHVLNYPNPFTTHTEFMFEHNQTCSSLDVQIQVFTVSGKLVKTIFNTVIPKHEGGLNDGITWNGRDDYGDKLAKGVYVYKLKVKTPSGIKEEVFEKLVILN